MKSISFIISLFILSSCTNLIKNENATIELEKGTIPDTTQNVQPTTSSSINKTEDLIGFWVGDFEQKEPSFDRNKYVAAGETFHWNRKNKINISIDKIDGQQIIGHSVVAGNNRPFEGSIIEMNDTFLIELKEPGNNQYDGAFKIKFNKKDTILTGEWKSYKKIDIEERVFNLIHKTFVYNPNQELEQFNRYIDWNHDKKYKGKKEEYPEDFESASEQIYKINASNTLLEKSTVENLSKGDLLIIRNTIYARHGYSFKNRPLRVFFDAQSWYIPVHADIKSDFTEIEKTNIKLLMKYEKNAKVYYDYFGRG